MAQEHRSAIETNGDMMNGVGEIPSEARVRAWSGRGNELLKSGAIVATAGLVAFLLGFVPMWRSASEQEGQRDAARRELRLVRIENSLASAVIAARRGDYQRAHRASTEFFTLLKREVNIEDDASRSSERVNRISALLEKRDEVITLLARSDPASADRLTDLYFVYLEGAGGTQHVNQSVGPEKVSILPNS